MHAGSASLADSAGASHVTSLFGISSAFVHGGDGFGAFATISASAGVASASLLATRSHVGSTSQLDALLKVSPFAFTASPAAAAAAAASSSSSFIHAGSSSPAFDAAISHAMSLIPFLFPANSFAFPSS